MILLSLIFGLLLVSISFKIRLDNFKRLISSDYALQAPRNKTIILKSFFFSFWRGRKAGQDCLTEYRDLY